MGRLWDRYKLIGAVVDFGRGENVGVAGRCWGGYVSKSRISAGIRGDQECGKIGGK